MINNPRNCPETLTHPTLTSELIPVSPRFVELPKRSRRARMLWAGFAACCSELPIEMDPLPNDEGVLL